MYRLSIQIIHAYYLYMCTNNAVAEYLGVGLHYSTKPIGFTNKIW